MQFSVLISVYYKEDSQYLDDALKSIFYSQTIIPSEVILVKDGPLTSDLDRVVDKYCSKFDNILKIICLEKNSGLGKALNIGLEYCTNEIIARVDTDDINHPQRFEKQLAVFMKNEELDVVGTFISEFENEIDNIIHVKKVPQKHTDIFRMSKKRNPMNHMSVMFKKKAVLSAGGYKELFYLEDYYLWIRMLLNKSKFYNINESLVFVRIGRDMYRRRSNLRYIKGWFYLQKKMLKQKMIRYSDLMLNMILVTVFICIPADLKGHIYKRFLRS